MLLITLDLHQAEAPRIPRFSLGSDTEAPLIPYEQPSSLKICSYYRDKAAG